jgi:NTPase
VDEDTQRLLLEGRPGIGKTTVAWRLLRLLREAGAPVGGFITGELRTGGRREGFLVEAASGAREVLAHVGLPGPPRVGRYGVDLAAFERVALPALRTPGRAGSWWWTSWARWSFPPRPSATRSRSCSGGTWPWWPPPPSPATGSPTRSNAGRTSG